MNNKYNTNTAFLDVLFNTLLAFVALFVLAFSMMNVTKNKKNSIESKAEFLITVTWNKDLDDDVDTYVEDPEGHLVCFTRREDGLMHLDRDDLGKSNDRVITQFGIIQVDENKEIVTLRGIVPGEYVINTHMYLKRSTNPIEVMVQVEKLNPYKVIAIKKVKLEASGDEKTALRMNIDKTGKVLNINELSKSLVRRERIP